MAKNQITFTLEEQEGRQIFTAESPSGARYRREIEPDQEVDLFDCIEHFMGDNANLFRGRAAVENGRKDKIKWTPNLPN